jgi:Ca-activated chloride channel homolog
MMNTPAPSPLTNMIPIAASPETARKAVMFGCIGAAGCLLGAILGEPLFGFLPPPPGPPQVDVLFVLDATSSMQSQIDGVQRGIVDFARQLSERGLDERVGIVAFRDDLLGQSAEVLNFGGEPFTDDYADFSRQVTAIRAEGGGDVPESSYDALRLAAAQPFREAATRVLLLITDAPPLLPDKQTQRMSEVLDEMQQRHVSQLHLVVNSRDRSSYVPLQESCPGEVFDLAAVAGGSEGFGRLLPVLGEKIAEATVRGLASSAAVGRAYVPRQLGITAAWTGLLACGVAMALIAGQNRYLHKPLLTFQQGAVGLGGGFLVGALAGSLGQVLGFVPQFLPSAGDSAMGAILAATLTLVGMLMGWALLGGLLGRGLAAFVPNLGNLPAIIGGVVGGCAAAAGFAGTSLLVGDLPGRLLGAALLGFCIGAMIALIEAATRDFYLEVRYGLREIIKVSLGDTPVTVGGDGRVCTVFAPSSPRPVVYKYWIADKAVQILDYATEQVRTIGVGDERTIGTVALTVRSGTAPSRGDAAGPAPAASKAPPPPPPPPTTAAGLRSAPGKNPSVGPQVATPSAPQPKPPAVAGWRPAAGSPTPAPPNRDRPLPPPPPPPPPPKPR